MIAVGRYARVTTAARTDVIGKVVEHRVGPYSEKFIVVRVPNWQADGYDKDWVVRVDEVERSTAAACKAAANKRWS